MDIVYDVVNNLWVQRIFWSIIVILASILIYQIIARVLDRHEKRKNKFLSNKKNRTFNRMIKSIARYAIIVLDCLIILQIFGIDISSMLAAAGIASVIIAFAIQDALKDIIRGFDIVSDNYYNVGDVVKIGTIEGKVLAVGLKTTKLQDINTDNTISIANRNIVEVEVMSGMIDLDIPLPYETKLPVAEKALEEAVSEIRLLENVTNAEYRKISNFSESSMDYRIKVFGNPALRPQIRRDALYIISQTLTKHKLSIPYPHLDVKSNK